MESLIPGFLWRWLDGSVHELPANEFLKLYHPLPNRPMPECLPELVDALKDDIRVAGIRVPLIVVDSAASKGGFIVDGHCRALAVGRLVNEYPGLGESLPIPFLRLSIRYEGNEALVLAHAYAINRFRRPAGDTDREYRLNFVVGLTLELLRNLRLGNEGDFRRVLDMLVSCKLPEILVGELVRLLRLSRKSIQNILKEALFERGQLINVLSQLGIKAELGGNCAKLVNTANNDYKITLESSEEKSTIINESTENNSEYMDNIGNISKLSHSTPVGYAANHEARGGSPTPVDERVITGNSDVEVWGTAVEGKVGRGSVDGYVRAIESILVRYGVKLSDDDRLWLRRLGVEKLRDLVRVAVANPRRAVDIVRGLREPVTVEARFTVFGKYVDGVLLRDSVYTLFIKPVELGVLSASDLETLLKGVVDCRNVDEPDRFVDCLTSSMRSFTMALSKSRGMLA